MARLFSISIEPLCLLTGSHANLRRWQIVSTSYSSVLTPSPPACRRIWRIASVRPSNSTKSRGGNSRPWYSLCRTVSGRSLFVESRAVRLMLVSSFAGSLATDSLIPECEKSIKIVSMVFHRTKTFRMLRSPCTRQKKCSFTGSASNLFHSCDGERSVLCFFRDLSNAAVRPSGSGNSAFLALSSGVLDPASALCCST